jgi:translocation and assembly module TamB
MQADPTIAPDTAPAPARRSRWRWWLAGLAALLLAVLLGLLAAARWTLATEAGARWLLARLPGVSASGVQGSVLGGSLRLQQLRIEWDQGRANLTLDEVAATGLRWRWRPADAAPGTWVALEMDALQVRQAHYRSGPPSADAGPPRLPDSLALPLQLNLHSAAVQTLLINELAPLSALRIEALQLDNRPGAVYAVKVVQAQWQGLQLQGSLQMAHAAPFATEAQLSLAPSADGDSPAWAASARAQGPLDRLALQATLRGVPRAERPAPSLDLRAELRLLQPWPLGTLQAQTEALDLSALHPAAPQTRLSGQAELQTQAADAPISARLQLDNALPGRWDESRLPARRLQLEAEGQLDQPGDLRVSRFSVELADALRPAGRWTGSARWQGHALKLDTRLDDIQPQRLDSRAPALRLTGPLALQLDGLPSLDPAAAGSPAPPWLARLQLQLQGLVEGAPLPVTLQLRAEADAHRLELLQAQAATGTARADTRAKLQRRDARSPWQLATSGQLNGFDPLPWLPGSAGVPGDTWRRGPHRLSGQWQFDLRLPPGAENLAPLVLLQRLAGNGSLQLQESLLAGLPLQADVQLRYTPGAGSLEARLNLDDAEFKLQARGDPGGDGASDQWQASLQAPQLAALAPLARLWPASAPWAPSQGSAQLQLAASGRWPEVRTEGHAQVQQLQAGKLGLSDGRFDWTLDLGQGPQQPLALTLDVAGLQLGAQRAEQLRGTVRGLLAEHRIDIEAVLPVLPPAATANVLGLRMPSPAPGSRNGTRGLLLAEGRWEPAPGGGGRWAADIERLSVGGWDGRALPALTSIGRNPSATGNPGSPTWAEARQLRAELQFDASGALASVRADAGELRLADTTSLRWDAVRADLQADPLRLELRAQVDPFPVAPLLARLQPELGWKGDLQLGARVRVMAGETFEADILVERSQGDLAAGGAGAGNGATQGVTGGVTNGVTHGAAMGLSELRLALRAQNGLWNFQADAAGALLGELRGALQVRSTPQARWPGPEAPMEGQLQLQVANIGIWNAWVPAGWRMAGSLQGSARVDGRFGAPRYTGVIDGNKLALRNLLQGVNITDGEVKIRLTGDEATIETFALRGGEGTLTVSGGAQFGERPRTRLQLQAERFRVLGRVDRQLIASGQATAELDRDSLRLDGRITADEGLFDISGGDAPSLDGDVNVRRPGQVQAEEADSSNARPRRAARVNLVLDLGQQLRLRGRGLDTGLRGQLTLTSPNNRLAANGSINTVDGSYVGYGQKMSIERGLVAFNGPLDNPRLDVLALRPNLDIRVGVAITGALSAYRVRLYSEPEMSENAKLSWLLLGREPDGLGRADTALLQRAAVALLSGEGEAPTDALLRNLGIDELSLRQSDGDVRETVITLGKQLGRRWYLGYERGVNATTGTWQLIYRIAQRFTLRAQSGLENSLDVIWVWRPGEAADGSRPAGSTPVRKSVVTPP